MLPAFPGSQYKLTIIGITKREMLRPGDKYISEIVFRKEDVETFARITGDYNPVHFDDQYASVHDLKQALVHGMLAASALSGVMGMTFPGKGSILMHRELTFIRPVYVGETYTMHLKVKEVDYASHRGLISTILKNHKNQICIKGYSRIKNIHAFSLKT